MPGIFSDIAADARLLNRNRSSRWKRLFVPPFNRGFKAVVVYRLSHAMWKCRIPLLPAILTRIVQHLYAIDISYKAALGPGVVIVHGFGIVIGSASRIEGDCVLYHGVTLGDRGSEWTGTPRPDGHPVVEKGCIFGAGAKVLGPIRVGRNSVVGANAVVNRDVPPCSIVAGVPARVIGTRPEMDENLRPVRSYPGES